MSLEIKGRQDEIRDPSGYTGPGKPCPPFPHSWLSFAFPSPFSFPFLSLLFFPQCDLGHGTVILQNAPQLENGFLSVHLRSSMAQGRS